MAADWQILDPGAGDPQLRDRLASLLGERLEPALNHNKLIYGYYLPLFIHLHTQVQESRCRPLVIGINGPQGGGKTTLTHYLVQLFEACDQVAIGLSIDDFYLTHEDQARLAEQYPDNPYLQQRGYPGTHDIRLGIETLSGLNKTAPGEYINLPRYDKSLHQGQGDRRHRADWPRVRLPVDVVMLEGWMLGFRPAAPEQIKDPHLHTTNTLLGKYHSWHEFLDSFIYLHPEYPDVMVEWRIQAEQRMKAQGLPGMTTGEVRSYANRFLPAYYLYGPQLLNSPPLNAACLRVRIGRDRLPVN